ncbi:E3 ubiquitin-protein ligase MARCH5 [Echinococcus granulosus]|nr:E3 ubiquitin-protein ligase MARCH5 [Echinococcus granulosus]
MSNDLLMSLVNSQNSCLSRSVTNSGGNCSIRSGRGSENERMCWICYGLEREDESSQCWIHPCRCCGSSKWVHQSCLQRWLDERQRLDPLSPLSCRMCGYNYVVEYPPADPLLTILTVVDQAVDVSSTYVFTGAVMGCLYWSAVTYGALTVMQVCGHEAGLTAMEKMDPVVLLLGLPAIPTCLVAIHMVDWQSWLLRLWRSHAYKLAMIQYLLPKDICRSRLEEARDSESGSTIPRILCTSLALPSFAVFFGRILFGRFQSRLGQAIAGGLFYLGFTGLLHIYQREMTFLRNCRRHIVEYDGE